MEREFVRTLHEGYELFRSETGLYVKTPEGRVEYIPPQDKYLYVGAKGVRDREEAERLVEEGKAKKYSIRELYREAFPDEETFFKAFYGMSKRMREWLDEFYKSKGVVKRYVGWEGRNKEADELLEGAKVVGTFVNPFLFSPEDAKLYKLRNDLYAIEISVTFIDTFHTLTFIFSRKPSEEDFLEVLTADTIEAKVRYKKYPETFICRRCGKETHFTEIRAETIAEKEEKWEQEWCGCA